MSGRFSATDVEQALALPDDASDGYLWPDLSKSVMNGDLEQLRKLHEDGADLRYQDDAGVSALMLAAQQGHVEIVTYLLKQGVPWNAQDKEGNSAGEYALEQAEGVLLDWAVLCEKQMMSYEQKEELDAEGERYLREKVRYEGGNLLDAQGTTESIELKLKRVLHSGLFTHQPRDVLQVRVLHGRWQDVAGELEQYDGIFFDTYSEHYLHMREFHELVAKILRKDGIYTFFNGLAPRCPFFSRVYRRVVSEELQMKGLTTQYMELPVQTQGEKWEEEWKGVKSRYWHQGAYFLPIIYFADNDEEAA